jgi:predicted nuclease of predicted toxin-antitoxin system
VRILLDEGVPDIIQKRLSKFSIFSVQEMGWRGVKNGILLDLMADDFRIIITTDKNLPSQQNLKKRQIDAIILPTNEVPTVARLLPRIEEAIDTISPGEFKQLEMPG